MQSSEKASCEVYIPSLNISHSWLLEVGSCVMTAELIAIRQALQILYDMETFPEEILFFSDSRVVILSTTSQAQTQNCHVSKLPCKTNSNIATRLEPSRPWLNIECRKTVAKIRRARKIWLSAPCASNKINSNRL